MSSQPPPRPDEAGRDGHTASGMDSRGLPAGYQFKPDWEVTPTEVHQRIKAREDLVLLDCRGMDEWQIARIDGAVLIPLGELERRADELETDEGGRTRSIVVHCHHGMRSMRAAAMLRGMGFTNVRSMAGGIDLWSLSVDPAIRRY